MTTPRDQIIAAVLESALDAGAEMEVAACRRLMRASHLGWRRHANQSDIDLVWEAYNEVIMGGVA